LLAIGIIFSIIAYSDSKEYRLLSSFRDNIGSMVLKESNVIDVKIFHDVKKYRLFYMNIYFDDGCRFTVKGINEKGMGDMTINPVNNCSITIIDKNGNSINQPKELQVWSVIVGAPLASITDIVKNYYAICRYVDFLPYVRDYGFKYGMEGRYFEAQMSGSMLKKWEIDFEVIRIMLAENLLPAVMLEQEYFFCIIGRDGRAPVPLYPHTGKIFQLGCPKVAGGARVAPMAAQKLAAYE
jgi:hypothetical protein